MSDILSLLVADREELAKAGKGSTVTTGFYRNKGGHLVRFFEHKGDPEGPYVPFLIAGLEARHVDAYISQRRLEGAGEHTIAKELVCLRAALKLARRRGLWRGDTAAVMPAGFSTGYQPRERALTWVEVDKLLAKLRANRAAHVAFIVATSACWQESILAQRGDVSEGLSRVFLRGTKTAGRRRTVPIITEEQRRFLELALRQSPRKEGELFEPWHNVRRDIHEACQKAGIEHCSPNDLRRTFATRLHAEGAPNELLAPVMGHKDTRMLERVYGRLPIDDLEERLKVSLRLHKEKKARRSRVAAVRRKRVYIVQQNQAAREITVSPENPRVGGSTPSLGTLETLSLDAETRSLREGFLFPSRPILSLKTCLKNLQNPTLSIESAATVLQPFGTLTGELWAYAALELAELRGEWDGGAS